MPPDVFGCVEGRFSAYKGTREAELRNSCHIYIPSKPPFGKGRLVASVPLAYGEHIAMQLQKANG